MEQERAELNRLAGIQGVNDVPGSWAKNVTARSPYTSKTGGLPGGFRIPHLQIGFSRVFTANDGFSLRQALRRVLGLGRVHISACSVV